MEFYRSSMTFLEAAIEVLRSAGRATHVRDITRIARKQKLLTHEGRDPEATMQQRLEAEAERPSAEIVRVRADVYALATSARPRRGRKTTPIPEPDIVEELELELEPEFVEEVAPQSPPASPAPVEAAPNGRKRRRRGGRGRGRGRGHGRGKEARPATAVHVPAPPLPSRSSAPAATQALAQVAFELLQAHGAGRAIHYRQLTDMALKRRLIPLDMADAWRAMRAALRYDERDRRAKGLRPRFRLAGNGLFALAEPSSAVRTAEESLARAATQLSEATVAAVAVRLESISTAGFETFARLLLRRMGLLEIELARRTERETFLRASGTSGSRLVALRVGGGDRALVQTTAEMGRAAGVRAAAWIAGSADPSIRELAEQHGLEIRDAESLARLCVELGVGVVVSHVPAAYPDEELLSDLEEPG